MTELEKILANSEEETEIWEPTMSLRWHKKEINLGNGLAKLDNVLQQHWISDRGNFEWRDIEVE